MNCGFSLHLETQDPPSKKKVGTAEYASTGPLSFLRVVDKVVEENG